ncbi:MAG: response regulator transcription factor [Firmicutes bacterium]|nr:response regulator transcription factor [Bacillota bacterium]
MYIALCDDKKEELEQIHEMICAWKNEYNIPLRCKTFRSAAELLDAAEKEPFTLYLLDVMMPGTNGLDAAKEIREKDNTAEIVFITSSPEFAYESYGVHALDYLLKPVRPEILYPLLDRLFRKEQKPKEGLTLKVGTTLTRIRFSDLVYVEVIGKHLYFNLSDGTVRKVYGTMKEYAPQLIHRPEFIQIHRSYIVNVFQTAELTSSEVRTFSGKSLPVSRLHYPEIQKKYMKLLFEKEN